MKEEQKEKISIAGQKVMEQKLVSKEDDVLNPENKNYMDLTAKERRTLEKEKLKAMGTKGKLQYIWMYYKVHMLAVILVIAGVFVVYDMYENSKHYAILSIEAVNASFSDSEDTMSDIKEILGSQNPYEDVNIGSNLITDDTGKAFDYNAQMAYVTRLANCDIDVMILPESLYNEMEKEDVFLDLSEILGQESQTILERDGLSTCLKIQEKEFCDLFGIHYEPAYVCVMVNSKNTEYAAKWLDSLISAYIE